ncbi:ATP-dependent Clp protease adaptor ClpS [Natronoflexus pectinivorans]|uniref:ATP-dependent Clp protease adaptor protein ClpS n=1 Tax=Natronoflexus pectinivorans TaxID=682526 RepID=A0A4R2GH34_9BACT|nr:ATP-dependent Clp protease adaptor ClpS [Natronoflexus pectinivorans]TCO07401.1 ATP-dependent Clp protease adaptor protein ClpS [Natronoflexus pectinivorans]
MVPFDKRSEKENAGNQPLEERLLILHNDEINTFAHVIESLQAVCQHDKEQAEQCALITHFKGFCEIKRGVIPELEQMQMLLIEKELNVTID